MWYVTQDYIKGRLSYLVENTKTGERCGEFDWQARAQEFADQLNTGDAHVVSHSERSESLKCAIDYLTAANDTLRREIVMPDAIMSIGKEGKT